MMDEKVLKAVTVVLTVLSICFFVFVLEVDEKKPESFADLDVTEVSTVKEKRTGTIAR